MSIYSEIKPEVRMFADMCVENSRIDRSFTSSTT